MALIKCAECGKEISDKTSTCINCGCPVITKAEIKTDNVIKKSAVLPVQKKKKIGCLHLVIVFFVVIGCIGILTTKNQNVSAEGTAAVFSEFENSGMTDVEISATLTALNSCGITDIASVNHDELLDNTYSEGDKGYRIVSGDIKNIILYLNPDGSVYLVRYAGNALYENGGVVASLNDFIITGDEMYQLQYACEEAVKEILISPSSAKFPSINSWNFVKQDGEIIIQSYVDSENAFGANLRSEFKFTLNSLDKTVKSFVFDGEELVK